MEIPRDIEYVHNKIIDVIPDEKQELKNELNRFINSIFHLAPEVRRSSFTYIPYQNILLNHLSDNELNEIWCIQVRNIFNKTDE